ncbi:MAG TPA: hypothetical protein VFH08_01355, partial [Chitinophagaceae bacterium]|nr:hypothetical protein [Chitinophagaceae bacterium]
AQLSLKNDPSNNFVDENFYTGKRWSVKQILKDSVLFQYVPLFTHGHVLHISHFSMISLSIMEDPATPVRPNVSDKLQSHLQKKTLYQPEEYVFTKQMCCMRIPSPKKYKPPFIDKFFFNYQ